MPISVEHIDNGVTFDIIVLVKKGDSYAKVRIANYHTNIVLVEKDGEKLLDIPVEGETEEGLTDRTLLNMEDVWDFINSVDIADIKEVIGRQIEYNTAIADEAPTSAASFLILMGMMSARGQKPGRRQGLMPG